MARFRFSLQAVLDQRKRVEEDKQRAVAVLQARQLTLEDEIRRHQRGIEQEREQQREFLGAGDLRAAARQSAAAVRLDAGAQRAVVELAGVYKRLEAARRELLEALKQRKAMELLRERREEEWNQQQKRREAAATDELVIMRARSEVRESTS